MAVATLGAGRHSIVAPSTLFIPGGRFLMGTEEGRGDERPAHQAEVRPVRMGRTLRRVGRPKHGRYAYR